MTQKKQKRMTREEALQLYNDLQSSMTSIMKGKAPGKVAKKWIDIFYNAINC